MPSAPSIGNWCALVVLGLMWGGSFMAVSLALGHFGPVTVAAGRIALGLVALGAAVMALRLPLPGPGSRDGRLVWLFALGMGFFSNALPFFLLAWAQQHVTSGFAGITMAAIPLFVIALAHLFVPGERLTPLKALGFVVGLSGVAVLVGPGIAGSTGAASEPVARLACLAAAASYATGAILTRRCPAVHPLVFGLIALLAATAAMVPLALTIDGVPGSPATATPLLAVIYLGLGSTALATLLLVHVIRTAGPSFLAQVNYHVPVWAVVLGTLFLAEPLPPSFLLALGLIVGGLMLSRMRIARPAT